MPAPVVALVTAAAARDLDEDLPPLVDALAAVGVEAAVEVWDDDRVDWAEYAMAVVRSTWDYVPRRDEFVAWAERTAAATVLANPPSVIRWSTDKRYLRELADAGVPVVPGLWFEPGDDPALRGAPHDDVVVKPAVSAGAQDTARYHPSESERALAHVRALLDAGRTAIVQPYLRGIDTAGETAVVHIDGELSHGLRKAALLRPGAAPIDGLFAPEDMDERQPTAAELDVAALAIAAVPGGGSELLYARVDLVPGPDGGPVVLELELAEPSLFFAYAPGAANRLAAAILRRLRAGAAAPAEPEF